MNLCSTTNAIINFVKEKESKGSKGSQCLWSLLFILIFYHVLGLVVWLLYLGFTSGHWYLISLSFFATVLVGGFATVNSPHPWD